MTALGALYTVLTAISVYLIFKTFIEWTVYINYVYFWFITLVYDISVYYLSIKLEKKWNDKQRKNTENNTTD